MPWKNYLLALETAIVALALVALKLNTGKLGPAVLVAESRFAVQLRLRKPGGVGYRFNAAERLKLLTGQPLRRIGVGGWIGSGFLDP